jgi:hypothetical protein
MDHDRESLQAVHSEHYGMTDFWELVNRVCEQHGISSASEDPAPVAEATSER